jgi:chromosome segregation ATPase
MSPLYYGGTDCPTCGATIPQDEPCQICALRAALTEKDREIERLTHDLDLLSTGMDLAGLQDQLSASQAREREAVRTAKIQADHAGEVEKENLHLESDLAAARKALERIEKEAYELGPEYWGLSDIARAALNGDSHATNGGSHE